MRNKLRNKLGNSIYDNFNGGNGAPMYDANGNLIKTKKQKKRNLFKKFIPVLFVITVLCSIIYLPQFFMREDNKGTAIMDPNTDAYAEMMQNIKNNGGDDFDKDGLNNYSELDAGTDPFDCDTDKDGMIDGADKDPLNEDDYLYRAILSKGNDMSTPYEINSVILWPDNKSSWIYGAVIEVQSGYQFTNFSGWAKFPHGKYAYQYVDGKHTLLPYRENANAWHITENCVVVLMDTQPENTYQISLFGYKFYLRNKLGDILATILPDKGWICASKMWLDDTFIETRPNVYSNYTKVDVSKYQGRYYDSYTNELESLADVYEMIDNGYYVLASILSKDLGESIVEVYGYTYAGDLIVADPMRESSAGILDVDIRCARALSSTNTVTERAWFEFSGCGYNSAEGALITFFAANPAAKD